MNKKVRKTLQITLISIFLISAPLLLAYTMGYRYNVKKNKIESIGALFLDSQTLDTQTFLNDKALKGDMPHKLIDLFPNEYSISVQKDGYYPWKKQLRVSSKHTTFADNIFLFKKSNPEEFISGTIDLFSNAPDNSKFIYTLENTNDNTQEIWMYEYETELNSLLYRYTNSQATETFSSKNILWANDSSRFLLLNKNNPLVIEASTLQKTTPLPPIQADNQPIYKWDQRNSNILYSITNTKIEQFTIEDQQREEIQNLPLATINYSKDFLIKDGFVYYFNESEQNLRLERIQANENGFPLNIIEIEKAPDYKIESLSESYIAISSELKQKTYLIALENDSFSYQVFNGKTITFNTDLNKVLFYNNQELWSADLSNGNFLEKQYLISRISEEINDAKWHNSSEYSIYATNNTITIIEHDGRDVRNSYEIYKTKPDAQINDFIVNEEQTHIYFKEKINGVNTIYSLEISESINFLNRIGL